MNGGNKVVENKGGIKNPTILLLQMPTTAACESGS